MLIVLRLVKHLLKTIGNAKIEVYSAGSKPRGMINTKAVVAMKALGYDLSKHKSKNLDTIRKYAPFDIIVTMGCDDECSWISAKKYIDWQIPDPKNMNQEKFNEIRDLIRTKVEELVKSL